MECGWGYVVLCSFCQFLLSFSDHISQIILTKLFETWSVADVACSPFLFLFHFLFHLAVHSYLITLEWGLIADSESGQSIKFLMKVLFAFSVTTTGMGTKLWCACVCVLSDNYKHNETKIAFAVCSYSADQLLSCWLHQGKNVALSSFFSPFFLSNTS